MRKEEVRGLIIYALMIVAAIVVGLTVIRNQGIYMPDHFNGFAFIIIVVIVAYLLNVIGLELLHVIGAKIGGYSVVSVDILGLCLYKKGKNWKLGFRDFDGISGETKVAPKKEKANPNTISWLPFFGFAFEIAACVLTISFTRGSQVQWFIPACTIVILISSMLALYNFVPLKLDSMTDGYKIRLFTKEVNVHAYNEMLRIQEKHRLGEEVKEVPIFDEITEYTAEINILGLYNFLEDEQFDKAEIIVDKLIENKKMLHIDTYNRMIAQKVYIGVLTKELEDAKKLYDEICPVEIRRFISNDVSMPSIRAYVLIAGMIEGSQSEVEFGKTKVEKAKKKALESEVKTEEKLLEKALNYVYEKHPKWVKEKAAE